ncbi:iron donor protein CyaY [Leeia oryzae]|uniref:iron donor protein CyaY n=1 Tax=Leeia oryzae TaxID=356662 RepID=UPI000372ED14|nr:iron donor protein CyaY [Leeia oryzae]
MEESAFLTITDRIFNQLIMQLDDADADLECLLSGNVLEIECDDGSKIIVNRHTPNQELWIAAKSGGFHFRLANEQWVDTRSGENFYAALSRVLSEQTGMPCSVHA